MTAVRCREIDSADRDSVLVLLGRGFPDRTREQLAGAFDRLAAHATPSGFPKYGYLLEVDGDAVGVILVVFSRVIGANGSSIRGNVASWYVEPKYRSYAAMLTSRALGRKDVTYLNLTPARHTWPILAAQGYKPLCSGQFASVPLVGRPVRSARIELVKQGCALGAELSSFEQQILRDHASYGCISVTCTANGRTYPFVFTPRRWLQWRMCPLPFAVLAYCRDVDNFVRFAGPLGRFLSRFGVALVFVDANGPIPGLVGRYLDWGAKFYLGPTPPQLGDLAYTERVMFSL